MCAMDLGGHGDDDLVDRARVELTHTMGCNRKPSVGAPAAPPEATAELESATAKQNSAATRPTVVYLRTWPA